MKYNNCYDFKIQIETGLAPLSLNIIILFQSKAMNVLT